MRSHFDPRKLTRKQVSALKRALARQGRKLPKVGWCAITSKQSGKYTRTVASSARHTSEVCHEIWNGKHVYVRHAKAPYEPSRRGPIRSSYTGKRWDPSDQSWK